MVAGLDCFCGLALRIQGNERSELHRDERRVRRGEHSERNAEQGGKRGWNLVAVRGVLERGSALPGSLDTSERLLVIRELQPWERRATDGTFELASLHQRLALAPHHTPATGGAIPGGNLVTCGSVMATPSWLSAPSTAIHAASRSWMPMPIVSPVCTAAAG